MEKYFEFRYTVETISMVVGIGVLTILAIVGLASVITDVIMDRLRKKRIQKMKETGE